MHRAVSKHRARNARSHRSLARSLASLASGAMAPRARNDVFDTQALQEALSEWARRKDCPFDWEFSMYSKKRRSQGPDREGILFYKPLVMVVVQFAPTCQPGHVQLRELWLNLLKKYKIMSPELSAQHKDVDQWASEAGDKLRLMLKHILAIKKAPRFVSGDLQEILDMVRDPATSSSSASAPPDQLVPLPQPSVGPPRALRAQVSNASSASVKFCAAYCKCPDCYTPPLVDLEESSSGASLDPSSDSDASSVAVIEEQAGDGVAAADPPAPKRPRTLKRPSAHSGGGVQVVYRKNPLHKRCAYILKDGKYWVGLSAKQHANYGPLIELIAKEVREGKIVDKASAVDRAKALTASGP